MGPAVPMARQPMEKTMTDKSTPALDVKPDARPLAPAHALFGTLRQEIDRLFDDFTWPGFGRPARHRAATPAPAREWTPFFAVPPAADFIERDGAYELSVDLPGFDVKDIEVRLTDGILTVRGGKSEERKEEKGDYHLRERSYGSLQRSVALPPGIEVDKVAATYANGVLKVTLPKTSEARAKERTIEVTAA